jgi:hypothetical protein
MSTTPENHAWNQMVAATCASGFWDRVPSCWTSMDEDTLAWNQISDLKEPLLRSVGVVAPLLISLHPKFGRLSLLLWCIFAFGVVVTAWPFLAVRNIRVRHAQRDAVFQYGYLWWTKSVTCPLKDCQLAAVLVTQGRFQGQTTLMLKPQGLLPVMLMVDPDHAKIKNTQDVFLASWPAGMTDLNVTAQKQPSLDRGSNLAYPRAPIHVPGYETPAMSAVFKRVSDETGIMGPSRITWISAVFLLATPAIALGLLILMSKHPDKVWTGFTGLYVVIAIIMLLAIRSFWPPRIAIDKRHGVSFPKRVLRDGPEMGQDVPVDQIAAIQLCAKFVQGGGKFPDYTLTQANLITFAGGRAMIAAGKKPEVVVETGHAIAQMLGVPVIDHRS